MAEQMKREGHEVQLFLAGDAVQLARRETAEAVQGASTGNVGEHWQALRAAGVPVFLSGMSRKARGVHTDTAEGIELAQRRQPASPRDARVRPRLLRTASR